MDYSKALEVSLDQYSITGAPKLTTIWIGQQLTGLFILSQKKENNRSVAEYQLLITFLSLNC